MTEAPRIGAWLGARALWAGLALLRRHRELWVWCALPALVNVAMFAVAVALFLGYVLDPLSTGLRAWLEPAAPDAWYAWLWVGPLMLLAWSARWFVLLALAAAVYLGFTLIGGVIASPFLDELSRRVEALRAGSVVEIGPAGLRGALLGAGRAIAQEAKRATFFAAVELAILAVGLVPGLQPVAGLAAIGVAVLFLPLEYTGFALDRRAVSFAMRRRWIWRHRGAMGSFGGLALFSFAVPGLNFVCLPWLVTAGTLLALDVGPPSPAADPLGQRKL